MEMKMKSELEIVSNCPLCKARGLHVVGEEELQTQQCINCGFATSFKFKLNGDKLENNENYKTLSESMQKWSKVANDHFWIPSFITLPVGMIFPLDEEDKMKWAYAPMVDIPEEERKNYPIEGQKDKFYERKYDTDQSEIHEDFVVVLHKLNEKIKSTNGPLPYDKLKTTDTNAEKS